MFHHQRKNKERGQGLVEYALIITLVGIVGVVIMAVLGPSIGNVFSNVLVHLNGGVVAAAAGSGGGAAAESAPPEPTALPTATLQPTEEPVACEQLLQAYNHAQLEYSTCISIRGWYAWYYCPGYETARDNAYNAWANACE